MKYWSFAKNERRFKMFEQKSSIIPIFPAYQSYVIPDLPFSKQKPRQSTDKSTNRPLMERSFPSFFVLFFHSTTKNIDNEIFA